MLALMTASFGTLSLIGGNSADLKVLIENYLSETTGMQSSIGTLNKFTFYPAMALDAENVSFSRRRESGVAEEVVRIGAIRFSIGFWSAALGKTRFRVLELHDAEMAKGLFLPQDLQVTRAGIDPAGPALVAEARYGAAPVRLHIDLQGHTGPAGIPSYALAGDAVIDVHLGDIVLKGILNRERKNALHLVLKELCAGDFMPVTGDLRIGGALKGQLRAGRSDFTLDLPFSNDKGIWKVRGRVSGGDLSFDDIAGAKGLAGSYRRIRDFIDGPELAKARRTRPYDFSFLDADVALSYKKFSWAGALSGPVSAQMAVAKNIVTLTPSSPDFNGGVLSGTVRLDATEDPGRFSARIDLEGMDYTTLQSRVRASAASGSGRVAIKLDVQATGNNTDQFWASLKGGIMAVAGPGEMTSSFVNLWGGGLVNAMLPGLDGGDRLILNCGVGSFRIRGPVAKADAIFLDTDKVTIAGEGSVNLRQGTLDLALDPESKDMAFLSVATSVDVTGSWKDPVIRPQSFSLMTRLGELFLGTINPAFLVFSMTDFGLNAKHPCKAYIKE